MSPSSLSPPPPLPSQGGSYMWPCSPSPLARHEARFFGPAQARPGPVANRPGLARPEGASRTWAAPQARGTARARPAPTVGPVAARSPRPLPTRTRSGAGPGAGAPRAAQPTTTSGPAPYKRRRGDPPNPNHSLDLSPPARRTRSLVRVSSRLSALALDPSAAARLRPSPAPVTTPTLLHLPPSSSPRLVPPYSPFLYSVLSISPDYVSSCYGPVPPPLAVDSSF